MAAMIGIGAELWLTSGASVLTKIGGLTKVNRPTPSLQKQEATNHDSANFLIEYIAGLLEPGELDVEVQFDIGSASDLLILEHLVSRATRPAKIIRPTSTPGTKKAVTFNTMLLTYVPDDSPVGDVTTAKLTGQVMGGTTQGNP